MAVEARTIPVRCGIDDCDLDLLSDNDTIWCTEHGLVFDLAEERAQRGPFEGVVFLTGLSGTCDVVRLEDL